MSGRIASYIRSCRIPGNFSVSVRVISRTISQTLELFVMLALKCIASCLMKLNPVVYPTVWSKPHNSVAEFFIRFIPCIVCTVVTRLPFTRPWYAIFKVASLRPESPITEIFRITRKAVIRVASGQDGSDHMLTTVLTRLRSSFLNEDMYRTSERRDDRVSLRVEASESVVRR